MINNYAPPLKALEDWRKDSPISKKALEMQAGLYSAIREGKIWAQNQDHLKPVEGKNVNRVFKLCEPRPAAFFKVGNCFEENQGRMEKLIWDMAILLGLEEQFVPTTLTELRSKRDLFGGHENAALWEKEGKLTFHQDLLAGLAGGIQVAQEGQLLIHTHDTSTIAREEVKKGILSSVLLGMYDAHQGNIFVTNERKIKFFDNTRSFPNSNSFIKDNLDIIPSFRCALLDLPQASEPLTAEELSDLQSQINGLQKRAKMLEVFLASPQTQAVIGKFPPGWFDAGSAMSAFYARLTNIETALANGKIKTALDIALCACPDYPLTFALYYLYYRLDNSVDTPHNDVGFIPVDTIVDALEILGIDIAQVQAWCKDLPFPELVEKLKNAEVKAPSDAIKPAYTAFRRHIVKNLAYDLKDISPADCQKALQEYTNKVLQKNGCIFVQKEDKWWILKAGQPVQIELKPFQEIILENGREIPLREFAMPPREMELAR